MKRKHFVGTSISVSMLLFVAISLVVRDIGGTPPSLEQNVQYALQRVAEIGSYRFTADVEQTLVPRPLPEMIGQRSERFDVRLEGEALAPDYARVAVSAEAAADMPPITLIQTEEGAFIQTEGELQPAENPHALTAPTGDYLDFLAAAKNIQPVDAAAALSAFTFEIDGPRLAKFHREQTEAALRASGALPDQIALDLSPSLVNTTGDGELWLDDAGLPRRLVLNIGQPEVSREYDGRAHIVMDFSDYGEVRAVVKPVQGDDGTWRLETTSVGWTAQGAAGRSPRPDVDFATLLQPNLRFFLALLSVSSLLVALYRRYRRQTYAVIVALVILSTIFSPLLQSLRVARFFEAATPALAAAPSASEPAPVDEHLDLPRAASAANTSDPDIYCGSGDANTDTDGDGLNDRDENCLGTDPGHEDSDRDAITDTLELDGLEWPASSGQMWYGDPLKVDTNDDGLIDTYEWPDPYGAAPEWDTARALG